MSKDLQRALVLAALMLAASLLAVWMHPNRFLADEEPRERLSQILPEHFGAWQVDRSIAPVPPSPDLQKVIDETYDETLALTYRNAEGQRVMVSLAYGRNQHKGMNTHKPEVCYPAQGFHLTTDVKDAALPLMGKSLPVKRVVAAMGPRNEPITYWVMVGNEVTDFGYAHRWVAIRYGMKGLVPDGVLMRVSSISGDNAKALALQDSFLQELLSSLTPAQRRRLVGHTFD